VENREEQQRLPGHREDRGDARDDRRSLGTEGEERAAAFLERRGFRIVGRRVRSGGVELDLVATRRGLVVFAEVKTRRSRRFGPPEEALQARQCERIVRGARAWLSEHPQPGRRATRRVRFDLIACQVDESRRWRIDHLEGAFDAGG
jgi:putative endonuclease